MNTINDLQQDVVIKSKEWISTNYTPKQLSSTIMKLAANLQMSPDFNDGTPVERSNDLHLLRQLHDLAGELIE